MKKNIVAACVLASFVSLSAVAAPVVTVNGQGIEKSQIDNEVKIIVGRSNGQVTDTPALREEIKNQLVNQVLVEQEAKKRGLDRSTDYKTAVTNFQSRALSELLVNDITSKNKVSDSEIKKKYDEYSAVIKGTKEVKLRQIVTNNSADAGKALSELNSGKSFDSVARKYSQDGSKDNGGLIDSWENLTGFQNAAPVVYNAISPLTSKGQYTKEVVNINGNFALFKLEDIRNANVIPFNDLKEQIRTDLLRQKVYQEIEALRNKATIK